MIIFCDVDIRLVLPMTASIIIVTKSSSVVTEAPLYKVDEHFKCFDGSLTLPYSYINDDYCDCPDASDEPGILRMNFFTFVFFSFGRQ